MSLSKIINIVSCFAVLALLFVMLFFPQSNKFDWVGPLVPFFGALATVAVVYVAGMVVGNRQIKAPGLLLLFAGWTILSFAFSEIRSFGFAEVLVTIASSVLFLYVAGENTRATFRKYLPHLIVLMLLFSAVYGIWTFLNTDHERFFGIFYNPLIKADAWPNAYASFFLLAFPFFIALKDSTCDVENDESDGKWKYLLIAILAGFSFSTFLLTYSRAAFIAFAIELVFLAMLLRPKFTKRCVVAMSVFLLFAVCSTFIIYSLKDRMWDIEALDGRMTFNDAVGSSSFTERFEFFEGSVELIAKEPLFGFGPMSFKWAYPQVQQGFLAISDHPHNVFLKYAVERGLPAGLFFLGLLIVVFLTNSPFRKEASTYNKVAWTALLGLLAHSMVDYNLNFLTIEFLFWIILATVYKGRPARFAGGGMALTGVLLTLMAVVLWQIQDFRVVSEHSNAVDVARSSLLLPRFAYYEIYDRAEGSDEITESALKKQLEINAFDSLSMWRLAQLYEKEGKSDEAGSLYQKALEINPKNTFLYYLDYYKLEKRLDHEDNANVIAEKVRPLIDEYENLYEINLHYTRSTREKIYFDELKSLIGS